MAYAVLLSLTQTIDQILSHDDHPISVNRKQQIQTLRQQAIYLQEFLEWFPKESMSLETRIRDTANQAEDVMEHFMYEHTRSELKSTRLEVVGRAVRRMDIEYDFRELKIVTDEINSIFEQATAIEIKSGGRPAMKPSAASSVLMPAPVIDTVTIGLEEKLKEIRGLLCSGPLERRVIPITGMGGIGKTTLARVVYEDAEVMRSFELRAWIAVSQNYKPENIFAELLFSLEKSVAKGLVKDGDTTEEKLHKILTANKFLIVLDDLWSKKAWDDLRKVFGDHRKHNGSRIVITTRNEEVASHADSSSRLQKMELMDEDKSWALLKHKVFPDKKDFPSELEAIARDVSKNCEGLPLAIVLVAGILCTVDKTPTSWGEIAKDVRAAVEGKEEFGKRISLSYTHLPLILRPLFLYMGGFPEDHEIRISKLIKLWIAEGFVKNEEEADGYLNNLVTRNLPTVTTIKSNGKFKGCNVHDLVRDMCKRNALDENYERRLSIAHRDLTRLARSYASTIRTVLSFQPNESSLGGLRKFKLLRVLDVVDTDAYSLPAPVFELFHLRYLAFGCPMEVPYAISRLQNLRALIIRPSKRLRHHSNDEVYLPLEIWMMPLLKHLVSFFDLLPNPEEAASALNELVTLTVVKKLICTEEMMKMISNLKKLGITYFGDRYKEDYQLQNLVLLKNLEKLTLIVEKGSPLDQQKHKPVFPKTLRKLTLSGWRFPWGDMKAVASLPNLQVLKLRDHACEGDKWDIDEESDGESDEEADVFPKLEHLFIDESDLEEWVVIKENFPRLKRLVFHGCGNLNEIPDSVGEIASLELIEVDRANMALVECVQRIHKELKDDGNTTLKIRAL